MCRNLFSGGGSHTSLPAVGLMQPAFGPGSAQVLAAGQSTSHCAAAHTNTILTLICYLHSKYENFQIIM